VTGDGTRSYTWTPGNQLAGVSGPVPASFSCDVLGRRVSKTVSGTTTLYRYDGLNLLQEQQGTPTPTVTATYLSGALDEVFTRTTGAGSESPLTDALGSTLAATNATGAITATATYGAFGQTAVAGTTGLPLYTGRERDETGLYYYRARYYQPEVGRFLSEDPLEARVGMRTCMRMSGTCGRRMWIRRESVPGSRRVRVVAGGHNVSCVTRQRRRAMARSVQFSSLRSGTRSNSAVLFVTSFNPRDLAWAAIKRSLAPIIAPRRFKSARISA